MKSFEITAWGSSHLVTVEIGSYANNKRPSIRLVDAADGLPYATASINMPDVLLLDGEVAIKDYSENAGILDFLQNNNIVTPTGKVVRSGHAYCDIVRINPESEWGQVPNLYSEDEPEYDSAGFTVRDRDNNQLDPIPDEVDLNTHKGMWIIDGYKIWAGSYKQALEMLPMIQSF